jgi:hypothetical protein
MRGNVAARALLNGPSQRLYGRLVRAFPGHVILAEVAVARLLLDHATVPDDLAAAERNRQWVADFVVCRSDFTALAVVEFVRDAAPGDAGGRRDQLLWAAGIKVVRVAAADLPGELALKALVAALPVKAPTEPPMSAEPLMRHAS